MANPAVPVRRSNRWLAARLVLVLVSVAAAIGLARPHLSAWLDLQEGKARLETDPQAARKYLDQCLSRWPNDGEAHFYAARAAHLCGEPQKSVLRHLDEASRLGWPAAEVEAQRTEIQEEFDTLVALATHLMAEFRWPEAEEASMRWLVLQPDSAKAWTYRSQIMERLRKLQLAVDALRQAVRFAPDDRRARFDLARLLLESHEAPEEAAELLERLKKQEDPKNPAVAVHLAGCREVQGRVEEAVALLDGVIAEHPNDPKACYFRGRLELNRSKHGLAVGYLRRAAELDPSDQEALYSLFLALSAVGTPEEIRAAEDRWKRCDADLKRVTELARLIVGSPDDPDLRREMGELFLRNGRDQDGIRWLQSALAKRPDHPPTHRLLGDYYERKGRLDLARHHRAFLKADAIPRSY